MSAPAHQLAIAKAKEKVKDATVPSAVFFLYCIFVFEYFFRLSARIPGMGQLRPTMVLFLLLTIALFMQADKVRDKLKEPPVQIILVLFMYLFVSFPLVEWPGSVIRQHVQPFILAVCFLFFTAMVVDTDRRLKLFVLLFVVLQAWRVIEPFGNYLLTGELGGRTHIGGGEFAGRLNGARADVINANGLGFVIVTTLAFMHFLMGGSKSFMIRFAYYGLAGTFLYALMLTSSRGAFVTLIVLVAFMIWDSKRKVLFVGLLAVASVLAWSGLSDFHKDRYLSLISSDTSTASGATADGRIRGMTTEFRLGLKRPIFGHGLGTTPEAKVNQLGGRRQAAHNLYAELLIEIGAIGAIIFLAYLFKLRSAVKDNLLAFKRAVRQGVPVDGFMLNLNKALLVVFWVYAVYSINYFGLSQDYWYIFGGLCIAFARSIKRNREVYFGTESAPLQGAGGAGTKRPLSA